MEESVFYEFLKEGFYGKKFQLWFVLDFTILALFFSIIYFPYCFIKKIFKKVF